MPISRENKLITIRYRQAQLLGMESDATLQSSVESALGFEVDGKPLSRVWRARVHTDGDHSAFLNHIRLVHEQEASYVFGSLVRYREGAVATAMQLNEDEAELEIQSLPLPDQRQLVDAMVFWLICENHVFTYANAHVPRSALEDYLSWLLSTRTNELPAEARFFLVDVLSLPAERKPTITEIKIGGTISPREIPPATESEHRSTITDKTELGTVSWARRVLYELVGDESLVNKLLRDAPEDGTIQIDLKVGFRSHRRKQPPLPLDDVAAALRNLDDADISLKTPDGELKGEKLRLSHPVKIQFINGLPVPDEVLRGMSEAYEKFIEREYIVPVELKEV